MWASAQGHFKAVELLLSKNANVDICSTTGYTALQIAQNHPHILELLVHANVNDSAQLTDDAFSEINFS